jgi:hypothetical protein
MSVRIHTQVSKASAGRRPIDTTALGVLRRKCDCGSHSPAGGCRNCSKDEDRVLRRKATDPCYSASTVPPIVHRVLNSPGRPLDARTREFYESRFDADLSHVRLHTNEEAARSAREVNAIAYTVGDHVALGAEASSISSSEGRRVLGHELVHTLQQKGRNTTPVALSDPEEASEREADQVADQALTGNVARSMSFVSPSPRVLSRIPMPSGGGPATLPRATPAPNARTTTVTTPTPAPPRGTNPAVCLESVCRLAGNGTPRTDPEATQRVDDWERASIACVRADAPSSNASHQAEIVTNEVGEIAAEATGLRSALGSLTGAGRYRDFVQFITDDCTRKTQEVRIEFHYNVVFENPQGSTGWGYGSADWASIESALAVLPPEATWTNPRLIRFNRSACHPDDLNASGQCVGRSAGGLSRSFTGGMAEPSTGAITIFNAGLGTSPFSRSTALRVPATQQTIRHEVGHIIMSQIAQAEQDRFFTQILGWREYSWDWITSPAPRYPNWQAARDALREELGKSEAELDTFLAGLQPNTPVTIGSRTYSRDDLGPGGRARYLRSVDPSQIPTGVEFEYARTDRGEYLAELYALAVSSPDFLHSALPQAQIDWLKQVVFHTPVTSGDWARQIAVGGDIPPGLLRRLLRVFTWEQAQPIIDEILRQAADPSVRGA